MTQPWAELIVLAITAYGLIGLLFAIPFVIRGVQVIDPAAEGSPFGFRLLILPGTVVLWPLLASRWLRRAGPPTERNDHRDAAR